MTETRSTDVLDGADKKTGIVELPGEVLDLELNVPLLHQVVNAWLAAARQGTHMTKTRGDVSGGDKKPYRQKSTGRARQGPIRAPQLIGGGIVHGSQPRDCTQKTPKKMKAAALCQALSDRARANQVHALSDFGIKDAPSTKAAKAALQNAVADRRALTVLTPQVDDVVALSVSNLAEHYVLLVGELSTYDVLANDDVVFSASALDSFLQKGEDE